MTVTLVVIYNHHFPQNIDRIERLYRDRFSDIVHLMPFDGGGRANVIPVYENSYQFQGYIAQASNRLLERDSEFFLVIADDLILNPVINEGNLEQCFALGQSRRDFVPGFIEFGDLKSHWPRAFNALEWSRRVQGVEVEGLLPSCTDARERFVRQGLHGQRVSLRGILEVQPRASFKGRRLSRDAVKHRLHRFLRRLFLIQRNATRFFRKRNLDFPLVGGYSDILLVSRETLPRFAQLSGIFAATDMFVEVAIPTAMVLASSGIATERDTTLKGRAYWGDEIRELAKFNKSMDELLKNFPTGQMYVHPVKLSQWVEASE